MVMQPMSSKPVLGSRITLYPNPDAKRSILMAPSAFWVVTPPDGGFADDFICVTSKEPPADFRQHGSRYFDFDLRDEFAGWEYISTPMVKIHEAESIEDLLAS